jgi:hypothetical protein
MRKEVLRSKRSMPFYMMLSDGVFETIDGCATFLQRGSVVVCFTKRSINAFAAVLFLALAVADLLSAVQNRE